MPTGQRRARGVAVAAAILLLALPGPARSAGTVCADPVFVRWQGWSCRAPGGWAVLLEDGTALPTHGLDPLPIHGFSELFELKPLKPSCVSDQRTQFHTRVIFGRPSDVADHYSAYLSKIRDMVYRINAMLNREAGEFGLGMRYRMACSGSEVSVARVNLGLTHDQVDFGSVVQAVRRAGYTNPFADYWIWVDATVSGIGGIASRVPDDRLSADNGSNFGPSYAAFYGVLGAFGALAMMHEGAHNLGAVQDSAPNSTRGGHCTDDSDVMCYKDGGALEDNFRFDVCRSLHFDCNHNDYFNPKPRSGSYLATHWNLGSPLNRFFAGCQYLTGQLTLGTAGQDVDRTIRSVKSDWTTLAYRSHTVSSACWGHAFAVSGVTVPPDPKADTPYAVPFVGPFGALFNRALNGAPVDVDVCFYKGSARLKCFASGSFERGTVPSGATSATVTLVKGAKATYVLSLL